MFSKRSRELSETLSSIVGPQFVRSDDADKLAYSFDLYWVRHLWLDRGHLPAAPDVIVWPGSAAEIVQILKFANENLIPVIPYGGGTASQGATLPIYGGIILDLKRLNKIIEIDTKSFTLTSQTGINGFELESKLNKHDLTLAHYPASQRGATLGGYLAARGAGTLSTKYGKAEEMVMSLEVVLPQGKVLRTLPVPHHATGPDLTQLFVGSEGTLGVITEAKMRVDPLPEVRRFHSFLFRDLHSALEAGRKIMLSRIRPCVIRLYDEVSSTRVVESVLGLKVKGAYMIIGFDGPRKLVEAEEGIGFQIFKELGGEDLGSKAGEIWWNHRYDFYFPPHMFALPWMHGTPDTVTTFDKIEQLYYEKRDFLTNKYSAWNLIYHAHFSHWFPWGVMMYDRFVIEEPPQDPEEAQTLHDQIWDDAVRISLKYDAVLNEHHGIGIKLGYLMPEQYGEGFEALLTIKNALDPKGIMNPGKMGFPSKIVEEE